MVSMDATLSKPCRSVFPKFPMYFTFRPGIQRASRSLTKPTEDDCENNLSVSLKGDHSNDCGPQQTHTQAQTQRHGTTNSPVFYLAEHRLPLGLIGSVDWFCPRVVRTLRAETATQLYWDALRLWADAAQSQVKQTVAKLKATWWPFPQILPSFVEVCMQLKSRLFY